MTIACLRLSQITRNVGFLAQKIIFLFLFLWGQRTIKMSSNHWIMCITVCIAVGVVVAWFAEARRAINGLNSRRCIICAPSY